MTFDKSPQKRARSGARVIKVSTLNNPQFIWFKWSRQSCVFLLSIWLFWPMRNHFQTTSQIANFSIIPTNCDNGIWYFVKIAADFCSWSIWIATFFFALSSWKRMESKKYNKPNKIRMHNLPYNLIVASMPPILFFDMHL